MKQRKEREIRRIVREEMAEVNRIVREEMRTQKMRDAAWKGVSDLHDGLSEEQRKKFRADLALEAVQGYLAKSR
jgi:hypothetical protein